MKRLYAYLIAALLGVALGTGIEHAYSDVVTTKAANPAAGAVSSGGTAITGGADTQVCFNDGGTLSCGDAGLTYNKTTDSLTVGVGVADSTRVIIANSSPALYEIYATDAYARWQINRDALGGGSAGIVFGDGVTPGDTKLGRDAANTLALRGGPSAQAFRVYNTFTDASNYERAKIAWETNELVIGAENAGTGTARDVTIKQPGNANLNFYVNGGYAWRMDTSKNFVGISATAGLGYATGAGGTVTQLTDKSTGVTCSKVTCEITMNGAALAANTTVSFALTNTAVAAADQLLCTHHSGGTIGAYTVTAFPGAGTATVALRNVTAGSLSEAVVLKCQIFKGATS